jgi:phage-related minor tail protein
MSGRRLVVVLGAIVVLVMAAIAAIYAQGAPSFRSELEKEFAKALSQLVLIGVIGVLAKALVDDYAKAKEAARAATERARAADDAAHKARVGALAVLTENYWRIKKALHMIEAHKSAKTYGEQMRAIIDHRLALQQLHNEIVAGMRALRESEQIGQALYELDRRLEALVEEWTENYLRLSRLQKEDEAENDAAKKRVPSEIEKLTHLATVRANRFEAIHVLFERAANLMRNEIWPERRMREPSPVPLVEAETAERLPQGQGTVRASA